MNGKWNRVSRYNYKSSKSFVRSFRVDPKELEGRVIEHGQTVVQLGNHYFTLIALFIHKIKIVSCMYRRQAETCNKKITPILWR